VGAEVKKLESLEQVVTSDVQNPNISAYDITAQAFAGCRPLVITPLTTFADGLDLPDVDLRQTRLFC